MKKEKIIDSLKVKFKKSFKLFLNIIIKIKESMKKNIHLVIIMIFVVALLIIIVITIVFFSSNYYEQLISEKIHLNEYLINVIPILLSATLSLVVTYSFFIKEKNDRKENEEIQRKNQAISKNSSNKEYYAEKLIEYYNWHVYICEYIDILDKVGANVFTLYEIRKITSNKIVFLKSLANKFYYEQEIYDCILSMILYLIYLYEVTNKILSSEKVKIEKVENIKKVEKFEIEINNQIISTYEEIKKIKKDDKRFENYFDKIEEIKKINPDDYGDVEFFSEVKIRDIINYKEVFFFIEYSKNLKYIIHQFTTPKTNIYENIEWDEMRKKTYEKIYEHCSNFKDAEFSKRYIFLLFNKNISNDIISNMHGHESIIYELEYYNKHFKYINWNQMKDKGYTLQYEVDEVKEFDKEDERRLAFREFRYPLDDLENDVQDFVEKSFLRFSTKVKFSNYVFTETFNEKLLY